MPPSAPQVRFRRALLPPRAFVVFSAMVFSGLILSCQAKIGDPCKRAYDCGVTVLRQCDMAGAKPRACNIKANNDDSSCGECTLENCSLGMCPEEAICIKVYTSEFLSTACNPDAEDIEAGAPNPDKPCDPDREDIDLDDCDMNELCGDDRQCAPLVNDCAPHEVCLAEGLCADEISARTSCRLECSNDGDCRLGYMCKETNTDGVYVAPNPENLAEQIVSKICVRDSSY